MKFKLFLLIILASYLHTFGQIDARLFQYPDVSESQIAFCYAGDIWVAPKAGGKAVKLSSPKGEEALPKFSPDGKKIAFSGNYNGNTDIYIISAEGGIPQRVTYHSYNDRMLGWVDGGDKILFSSSRESGRQRYSQFYTIPVEGGFAEKLPVPYGEFGMISGDGDWIAYTTRTRLYRTWKRYRGGMAADIYLFNLKTFESKNITNSDANDEMPMWHGSKIYYLSDAGKEKRYNIWVYDLESGKSKQLTDFSDYDIHFPSIGPKDLVFEAGGELYLMDLENDTYKEIKIEIISDQIALIPEVKEAEKYISTLNISPDGNRALIEARGDIFSVPAKEGVVYNLTNTSDAAERYPAWSPDGKYAAYWSDESGEYELMLNDFSTSEKSTLTSTKLKYKYNLYWSPDSKKLVFVDNAMNIRLFNIESKKFTEIDKALDMFQGALANFYVSWSSDSRYIAYSRAIENNQSAIFIFDAKEDKLHQATSGFYSDSDPVFDPEGKYLYLETNRHFSPVYSRLDNTFIYPNATNLAAIPLTGEIASPLAPKNDEVKIKEEEREKDENKESDDKKDEKEDSKEVKIDFKDFESRIVILPVDAGNFAKLAAVKGKLIYHKIPNSGSNDKSTPIKYFDLKDKEENTIIDDGDYFEISADGNKMLTGKNGKVFIVDVKPNQKLKDALPTSQMEMTVIPKNEFKQIFNEAWRIERDFFYDPAMHGLDWKEVHDRYGRLVEFAANRSDLNFLLGEMIGELNASHTYKGGGDLERADFLNVGYLGINWEKDGDNYKIADIIKGAEWDAEAKSPLAESGVDVKVGDYILAVNGKEITTEREPYAWFAGLANETVELTINNKSSMDGAKKIYVKTMSDESRLRHLAWISQNKQFVDKLSNGQIGYIYVRSTGVDGQNELIRQFLAQTDKKGLIIDERFNNGGQIPDRFIEMLNRKPLAFWKVRDGRNWQWPPDAHFGPKAMLINGWSGSGGDAFPDYFRKAGLGKLIGKRTWGGLIGISGAPALIDGGGVTVPTFRMYDPDGKWFKEGHGVDPDIEVDDDPTQMAKGIDPQLKRAAEEVMEEIKSIKTLLPEPPAPEKR